MEYSSYDTDPAVSSQLTENFSIETDYKLNHDRTSKKFDHFDDHALHSTIHTLANSITPLSKVFSFLIPKKRDNNCSH